MRKSLRVLTATLGLTLLTVSCYGPFNATRRVHEWNGQVGSTWVNEGVFLAFVILPVYSLASLGDALIFNTIEFWGGENPVNPPGVTGE